MFVTKNLYQNDAAWAKTPLGNSNETIGGWGCLLTSATMLLNGIGYDETPASVNEKMKAAGGFRGALFIPSVMPYVWSRCAFRDAQPCESSPAPIAQIDEAVAQGKPVIVQVDWNKQAGIQTHFVLIKEKKGADYSIYDPYKYPGDAPSKEVLLTKRYRYNGATLASEISAVLWFDVYGEPQPEEPQPVPLPADALKLYVAVDDLALRAEPSVNGYLYRRMALNEELFSLEEKEKAKAKLGVQGRWLHVQDSSGKQGYAAAWFISAEKNKPAEVPAAPTAAPAPIPPGVIALYPTVEVAFRAHPNLNGAALRYIPPTEQLISLEPATVALSKIGAYGQWIKVRGADKQEGYVAAWFLKYAGGSSASAAAQKSGKVKTTAEQVALRSQPIISGTTLIKRVPINYEFSIVEPGGEAKIGKNDQWVKVKDDTHEGYVAAWFLKF